MTTTDDMETFEDAARRAVADLDDKLIPPADFQRTPSNGMVRPTSSGGSTKRARLIAAAAAVALIATAGIAVRALSGDSPVITSGEAGAIYLLPADEQGVDVVRWSTDPGAPEATTAVGWLGDRLLRVARSTNPLDAGEAGRTIHGREVFSDADGQVIAWIDGSGSVAVRVLGPAASVEANTAAVVAAVTSEGQLAGEEVEDADGWIGPSLWGVPSAQSADQAIAIVPADLSRLATSVRWTAVDDAAALVEAFGERLGPQTARPTSVHLLGEERLGYRMSVPDTWTWSDGPSPMQVGTNEVLVVALEDAVVSLTYPSSPDATEHLNAVAAGLRRVDAPTFRAGSVEQDTYNDRVRRRESERSMRIASGTQTLEQRAVTQEFEPMAWDFRTYTDPSFPDTPALVDIAYDGSQFGAELSDCGCVRVISGEADAKTTTAVIVERGVVDDADAFGITIGSQKFYGAQWVPGERAPTGLAASYVFVPIVGLEADTLSPQDIEFTLFQAPQPKS